MVSLLVAGVLSPVLQEKLQALEPGERMGVLVHLAEQPVEAVTKAKSKSQKAQLVRYLRDLSYRLQDEVISQVPGELVNLKRYWVFNGFYCEATKDQILALAKDPRVAYVVDNREIRVLDPPKPGKKARTPEWNISKIGADRVWSDYGIDGSGRVIGAMDTGVDTSHPALRGKMRQDHGWFDAVNGNPNPYDDYGHGTHVTGTMVGGDGPGPFTDDIGVAPGAQFIHVKMINASGTTTFKMIHDGFQWIADLAELGLEPDAVQNSWGWPINMESLEYWHDVLAWRAVGIIPVFSNGNEDYDGPRVPASYPTVISVGATDSGDNIASFSSRGPAPSFPPWSEKRYWSDPQWNSRSHPFYNPFISAPGVNIRSSVPGGDYEYMSGTSMAGPHVTGTIALLKQANPALDYDAVFWLLTQTAYQPTSGLPDNNYGWGRLDAYEAVTAAMNTSSPVISVVSWRIDDSSDGNGDGYWNPGELVKFFATLHNSGSDASAFTATIEASDPYLELIDADADYPALGSGEEAENSDDPFWLKSDTTTPCGHEVLLTLLAAGDTFPFWISIGLGPGQLYKRYAIATNVATNTSVLVKAAAQSPTTLYYVTDGYSYIYKLDPETGDSLGVLSGPYSGYTGAAWDWQRGCLWLVGENRTIYQIDTSDGSVINQFTSPSSSASDIAYDPTEDVLWVLQPGANAVIYKVDPDDGSTLGQVSFSVPYTLRGLAFDPAGPSFVLTLYSSNRSYLAEYDLSGNLLDSVRVSEDLSSPWAVEFTPDSFYVMAYSTGASYWSRDAKGVRKVGTFHCSVYYTDVSERFGEVRFFGPWPSVARGSFKLGLFLPRASEVRLRLYDAAGRAVWLNELRLERGLHTLTLRAPERAGVYFLQVKADGVEKSLKLTIR